MRLPFGLPASLGVATQSFLTRIPFRLPMALGAQTVEDASASLMLRSYRFRYDDGSQSAATWKAAADAPWGQPIGQVFRLRFLLQRITTSAQLSSFTDDFSLPLDPLHWDTIGTPGVSGGHLVLPCGSTYSGVNSHFGYTLLGSHVAVRVVSLPTDTGGSTETSLMFFADPGNLLMIEKRGAATLVCRSRTAGVNADFTTTWDSVAMAWWRIREAAGTVYFETSPDGLAWSINTSVATPAFASAGTAQLLCGYSGTETSPGNAVLDDLNLYPGGPPSPPLSSTTDWQTFYSLNGAGWLPVTGSSSVVRAAAATGYVEGAATTQQLGSRHFVAGTVDELDGYYGPSTLTIGDQTELEGSFRLVSGDVHVGDSVAIIITRGNFSFLEVYNRTPTLTVAAFAVTYWNGTTELPATVAYWDGSVENAAPLVEVAP